MGNKGWAWDRKEGNVCLSTTENMYGKGWYSKYIFKIWGLRKDVERTRGLL